jgi:hypothetical protein
MYNPRSDEPEWEWIEVFNNTGTAIDFASTPYVFDDDDDASYTEANITFGAINNGEVGVLYNAAANTLQNLQDAWGDDINFIAVSRWTDMANGGDTIALWDSLGDYQAEQQSNMMPRRTITNAIAAVVYDDNPGGGWPSNDGNGSIFLADLSSDPTIPESWLLSDDSNSRGPQAVEQTVVDHPGGDIGSPGFVPGSVTPTLEGDYNADDSVDAADYIVWRKMGASPDDYSTWRENFGRKSVGGSALAFIAVPEPSAFALLILAAINLHFTAPLATRPLIPPRASRAPRLQPRFDGP